MASRALGFFLFFWYVLFFLSFFILLTITWRYSGYTMTSAKASNNMSNGSTAQQCHVGMFFLKIVNYFSFYWLLYFYNKGVERWRCDVTMPHNHYHHARKWGWERLRYVFFFTLFFLKTLLMIIYRQTRTMNDGDGDVGGRVRRTPEARNASAFRVSGMLFLFN